MKNSVQLCASDTLMQGLIARYGRDSFSVLCSIEHFQEIVFNYEFTGARYILQSFLDVKQCVQEINDDLITKSLNCKNAFLQNISDVAEAFRFLAMSDYQIHESIIKITDEQKIFFEYIYKPLVDIYKKKYFV